MVLFTPTKNEIRINKIISKALKISATAHEGQYDKHGQPYFLHCLKVMRLLKSDDE